MKDFEANCLLLDALEVTKTSAIKNKKVQKLLNAIMVTTMDYENEYGRELSTRLYEILKSKNYYSEK